MLRSLICVLLVAALIPAPAAAQVAYTWGNNQLGQLGNGSTTQSTVPVAVSTSGVLNGLTITAVAASNFHSLALANGQVFAWGNNDNGQLGNSSSTQSTVPVAVSTAGVLNGLTVTAVAAGNIHSLVLANGQVFAWGANFGGQLGNASTTTSTVPVAVSTAGVLNGLTVTAVAAGSIHSLALANGQVFAWGNNNIGQLGNGSSTQSTVPVAVSTAGVLNGLTVTAVAAGNSHSLALANGQVFAWGDNSNGQLGNGSTTQSTVPIAVSTSGVLNGLTITAVAGGGTHSLVVANGRVYSWGNNINGQLGNGSTTDSTVPVAVSSAVLNGLTVIDVAAGFKNSYALTDTGRLFAWGNNSNGELGLGNTTSLNTPQEVFAPTGFIWASIDADSFGKHVVATLTPVPEPGALLLGVAATGWLLRARWRQAERPATS